jgi:Arc/MetJ-type ribon-helix-helix transcriptional regulator
MPPSRPRLTIRLSPDLAARVAAHVGHGRSVSDIVRQALEAYLGGTASARPTRQTSLSDTTPPLSDASTQASDSLSDIRAQLEAIQHRLTALETASAPVRQRPTPRPTPRPTRPPSGAYDPDAAYARMQTLQAQGLSLAQIAAQLTAEGIPTRRGKPWHKGTVGYLLQQAGR